MIWYYTHYFFLYKCFQCILHRSFCRLLNDARDLINCDPKKNLPFISLILSYLETRYGVYRWTESLLPLTPSGWGIKRNWNMYKKCWIKNMRIIHIDLYKDEVKKNLESLKKNIDKNDDFIYSIPLFCCRFFFWIRRLKSLMFLVLFYLFIRGKKCSTSESP
jgi:hypothetical protein